MKFGKMCGKFRIMRTRIILLQNMPHIFPNFIEFEGKEQGSGFEVADLENEQDTVLQIVVSVGQGTFFGRKAEEMRALFVVEPWESVQLFDLQVFQDLEPVFEPVRH